MGETGEWTMILQVNSQKSDDLTSGPTEDPVLPDPALDSPWEMFSRCVRLSELMTRTPCGVTA